MTRTHSGSNRKQSFPSGRWLPFLFVLWGLLLASIVGADGVLGWRIFRIVLVLAVTVGGLWILARKPRSGAAAAIVFGTISLALSIAFGFRYLMVDGLSWQAAAGLVELPVGIGLLVLGGRLLLSGTRGWRFIAAPALVLVIAVVAWIITPALLATNVPPIKIGSTPLDFGLTAQDVRFTAADGTESGAWYVPSANRAAVVLRHGSGSTGSDVQAQAAVLVKHGYGVLITDARGHGRSSGRAMDFGWYGNADIEGAVSFLAAQPGIDAQRIGVVGFSMGGEEAIGAIASDPRIAAVVAEGVTGRTDADKTWLPEVFGVLGQIQTGIEWAQYSVADLLTEASKPVSLAEAARLAAPRPILLIAAEKVEDEGYAAAYFKRQSPASVTVWTVPGSGHIQGLSVAPVEWENKVINFLNDTLFHP